MGDNVGDGGTSEIATEGAVRAALAEIQRNDVAKAKLALAAELILRCHPCLAHIGVPDLVQESSLRTLDSRRKWRPGRIGILGHLIGAMRSIASAASKSAAKGTVKTESLDAVNDEGEPYEVVPLEPVASVEDEHIAKEEQAGRDAKLEALEEALEADPEARAIYECLCQDMHKRDIRAKLGMTSKVFWTVDRRLSRLIDRHLQIHAEQNKP